MFHWRARQRDFSYVTERIAAASFSAEPFRHIYIDNVFSRADFHAITRDSQIRLKAARTDAELIELLYAQDFKEISFPGTTTDVGAYLKWHMDRSSSPIINQDTCEGFGVTLRLQKPRENSPIEQLLGFLSSQSFWNALRAKFLIEEETTYADMGIQKYLDGYEISPHPDIRKKALTFMVNINPSSESERLDHHTHYMSLVPRREYVRGFWNSHPEIERCWVPWSWCRTERQQTKNNSMVIFAPANDTLHAVRAKYNHLRTQRTQIYGNLWFKERSASPSKWQDIADEKIIA